MIKTIVRWVWDAAVAEPQVAIGLFLSIVAFLLIGGYFSLLALAILQEGEVLAAVSSLLIGGLAAIGIPLAIFVTIAGMKLWLQVWTFGSDGIDESWVNPRRRLEVPSSFIYYFGRTPRIVRVLAAGSRAVEGQKTRAVLGDACYPFVGRQERSRYSWVDVHNWLDKRRAEEHFRPTSRSIWEKINYGVIFGIIALSLFWGVALVSEAQKAAA